MGVNLSSSQESASQVLADRMDMCGTDRGCREMFTAKGNNFSEELPWYEIPNKDLSDDAATKLCARIKDDGMCLHFRNTQGKTITESNPKLQALKNRMEQRLYQLLPRANNTIPIEVISLYPDLNQRYEEMKDGNCFKSHFSTFPGAPGIFVAKQIKRENISPKDWADPKKNLLKHVRNFSDKMSILIDQNPIPECAERNKEIKSLFFDLEQNLGKTDINATLNDVAASIYRGTFPEGSSLHDENSEISRLIGKDLLRDYMKGLDSFHYKSPKFDCIAAGLAPFRFMEEANRAPACE